MQSVVQALCAQDYPAALVEIIVAEGRSDDDTRTLLDSIARSELRLRVIDNPEGVVSTGLNRAIHVSRGDVIIRMDAHTTYATDYVSQCIDTLQSTHADNVGGPWTATGTGLWGRAIAAAFSSPFCSGGSRARNAAHEGTVDTVYLGCWPRRTFERFGSFDEELVRNQDDEHNLRILRGGGTIWQSPKIRSYYTVRSTPRQLFRQHMQYGYWKVRVIQKHGRPAALRHVAPVFFLLGAATGWSSWFVSSRLSVLYIAFVSLYLVLNIGFSVAATMGSDWRLFLRLPLVFAIHHVSYGWGFSQGVLDFVVRKKGTPERMTRLSRRRH